MHSRTLPYQKYFVDFNKISYYILELKGLVKAATVTCNEIRESIMLLPTTLSALILPALIPPHFANVAVIRAGGRKGRRKKRPAEKRSGYRVTQKSIPSQYATQFSVEFRLFLTN